jgi:hypothetical protein
MQDFFTCEEGFQDRAARVAHKACYKLVKDMHYKVCVQAVVTYNVGFLGRKISKREARNMTLTREQYLQVNIEH